MAIDPAERQESVAELLEDAIPLLAELQDRAGEGSTEALRRDLDRTLPVNGD